MYNLFFPGVFILNCSQHSLPALDNKISFRVRGVLSQLHKNSSCRMKVKFRVIVWFCEYFEGFPLYTVLSLSLCTLASSPVPHKRGPGIHWLRTREKCVGIAWKMRGHDQVLITGVASEYSWKSTRDVEVENSRSSRFTAMPATVLCRLCSRTAGQQFTELYYYVIRSTDVYGRYPISPENLGNLSMRSQCIPGPLLWGTGDEAICTPDTVYA